MEASRNFETGDAGYPAGRFLPIDFFQDSAARHRNHHDARGGFFAECVAAWHLQRMAEEQLLEGDGFAASRDEEAQCLSTESANGTRSDFKAPDSVVVQAKFGVQRAVSQTHRSYGAEQRAFDGLQQRCG